MSVAVLIPSRDRPERLVKAIRSVLETSLVADVLCYIDHDQRAEYDLWLTTADFGERVKVEYGPRIGPVASVNMLIKHHPNYSAYGLITDDTKMVSMGWDSWLLSAIEKCPNRIAVVSPRHNLGEHVDMPFVSREWIDTVGWFACPVFYHYCWPILIGVMGEMSAIVHAPDEGFSLHHEGLPHTNTEVRVKDELAFFNFVALRMPVHVESLRRAMEVAA